MENERPRPPRLHNVLVDGIVRGIWEIFYENHYADKVIERLLKSNPKWGSRDRAFVAEGTYELVRWWRKWLYIWNKEKFEPAKSEHLYQLFAIWFYVKYGYVPDSAFANEISSDLIDKRLEELESIRAVRESVPDWLDTLGEKELGPQWDTEIAALNIPARPVIRANTLVTSVEKLQQALAESEIDTEQIPGYPDALLVNKRASLFVHKLFHAGWFEMQDASSQRVAEFMQLQPGMRVIDACAGAGGKSLHMAALMQNKGSLISMDVEGYKLAELKRRAKRAKAHIIETRLIEGTKTIKRLEATADRLLLDVPCSGSGVLRRNPDAKWKLSPEFIEKVQATQRDILERYSEMVKPGGKMVYATCSIFPSENRVQVDHFLAAHSEEWSLAEENIILPSESSFDGFYMALLEKK